MHKMNKINQIFTHKTDLKAHHKLFLIGVVLLLSLFLIPNVSAFDFDNIKTYDEETKTVDIRNSVLGIPFLQLDKVATIKLESDLNVYVMQGKDRKVAEFTISNHNKDYSNAFKKIETYNAKNMKEINRNFVYKYRKVVGQETIKEVELVCEDYEGKKQCKNVLTGKTHNEDVYEWVVFKELSELPDGEVTIGIFTDVYEGDYVEWIPTFFGVRINEWATWTSSFNTDLDLYWAFNENTGTLVYDNSTNYNNGTFSHAPTWVGGLVVDYAVNFSGAETSNVRVVSQSSTSITGADVRTINFWAQNDRDWEGTMFNLGLVGSSTDFAVKIRNNGGGREWTLGIDGTAFGTGVARDSNVNMHTVTYNGTTAIYYLNNVEIGNFPTVSSTGGGSLIIGNSELSNSMFGGVMDEVALWTRELSTSEITDLYNGGSGLTYVPSAPPQINATTNLITPANATLTVSATQSFNATITPTSANITNGTLYVWYDNSTIITTSTNSITGDSINSSIWTATNIPYGNLLWNVYGCVENTTNSYCSFAPTNNSLTGSSYTNNSQTYSATALEGSVSYFELNWSLRTGYQVTTAYLNYNNTLYEGTVNAGTNTIIYRNLTIPEVTTATINPFHWIVNFNDGSQVNTSLINQTVNTLGIDDCSVYTNLLFNMSMMDEESQIFLEGGPQNTSIKLSFTLTSIINGEQLLNYSKSYQNTNPARLCLQNALSTNNYRLDGVIEYSSLGRFQEFYNFQNYLLNNNTANLYIPLYNLNSSVGQEYKITYKDSNFVPVDGAIMNIQRKYIDEGIFKTTEVPKTGAEGYTIGHLVSNDVIYNIIVIKEGVTLATFTDVVADCQNPLLFSCAINLNSFSSSNLPSDFTNYKDISYTLTYNRTSRTVSSLFTIPSGIASVVNLNVTLFDRLGTTNVCSDELTSSGGTLSCVVPASFGNSTIIAQIFKGGEFVGQAVISLSQSPMSIYGSNLLFISLMMCLVFIGVAISTDNPMTYGIILGLGSVIMVALNLIYSPSLVGMGATVLWFIIAIVLVMIKGGSRQ